MFLASKVTCTTIRDIHSIQRGSDLLRGPRNTGIHDKGKRLSKPDQDKEKGTREENHEKREDGIYREKMN